MCQTPAADIMFPVRKDHDLTNQKLTFTQGPRRGPGTKAVDAPPGRICNGTAIICGAIRLGELVDFRIEYLDRLRDAT
jgi:hypothetical protein